MTKVASHNWDQIPNPNRSTSNLLNNSERSRAPSGNEPRRSERRRRKTKNPRKVAQHLPLTSMLRSMPWPQTIIRQLREFTTLRPQTGFVHSESQMVTQTLGCKREKKALSLMIHLIVQMMRPPLGKNSDVEEDYGDLTTPATSRVQIPSMKVMHHHKCRTRPPPEEAVNSPYSCTSEWRAACAAVTFERRHASRRGAVTWLSIDIREGANTRRWTAQWRWRQCPALRCRYSMESVRVTLNKYCVVSMWQCRLRIWMHIDGGKSDSSLPARNKYDRPKIHSNFQTTFAPGGYLHDETSDTQIFGFTESQSRSRALSPPRSPEIIITSASEPESPELRGWSQGDPANPYDPASDLYHESVKRLHSPTPSPHREPPTLLPSRPLKRPCHRLPKLEEAEEVLPIQYSHRARPDNRVSPQDIHHQREEYLEHLAALLFGQSYANGQDPHDFPLLLRFGGSLIRNTIISPESIQPATDEDKAFVARFVEACWQSDPPNMDSSHIRLCNDPNALQREYLALFVELTNHIPRLVQTMMDPGRRDDLSATTESMGRIIDGIRLLVGVQKRAQDELATTP
ncbi:hypothetical protein GGX14DRAFT_397598 [Mycena pura]|uniref:Uncharacterized protein n=1 Tax=Mycena pura TaxID=153505 RepID=A0AAD6VAD4_9AGAR|nr:hypothetical protein GGX14DRAFT_397598 [Mycena pura]